MRVVTQRYILDVAVRLASNLFTKDFTCNALRSLKALSSVVCIMLLCSNNSSKFSSPERSFSLRIVMLLYLTA